MRIRPQRQRQADGKGKPASTRQVARRLPRRGLLPSQGFPERLLMLELGEQEEETQHKHVENTLHDEQ